MLGEQLDDREHQTTLETMTAAVRRLEYLADMLAIAQARTSEGRPAERDRSPRGDATHTFVTPPAPPGTAPRGRALGGTRASALNSRPTSTVPAVGCSVGVRPPRL